MLHQNYAVFVAQHPPPPGGFDQQNHIISEQGQPMSDPTSSKGGEKAILLRKLDHCVEHIHH
jgi:hypothetical protein